MIDSALVALLRQHAGVGERVFSGGEVVEVAQQLPKVVYTLIDVTRLYSDDGNAGLATARYQLDIFAVRPSAARAIADEIRVKLDGFGGTNDGTVIDRIWFDDGERMERPQGPVGQAATAARYAQDLRVTYRERVT